LDLQSSWGLNLAQVLGPHIPRVAVAEAVVLRPDRVAMVVARPIPPLPPGVSRSVAHADVLAGAGGKPLRLDARGRATVAALVPDLLRRAADAAVLLRRLAEAGVEEHRAQSHHLAVLVHDLRVILLVLRHRRILKRLVVPLHRAVPLAGVGLLL